MPAGGRHVAEVAALKSNKPRLEAITQTLREDGGWIDSGENDNRDRADIRRTRGALGVFGYSFLEQNPDQVKAATRTMEPGMLGTMIAWPIRPYPKAVVLRFR